MQQNLLNAGFASGEYRNAGDKNMHVFAVMKALTKVSRHMPGSFCCIYACCQLHFLGKACFYYRGRVMKSVNRGSNYTTIAFLLFFLFIIIGCGDRGGGKHGTPSHSLSTWHLRYTSPLCTLCGVTYANGTFVAVGDDIVTSPEGRTWTSRNPGITGTLSGVTYGNGIFVAVGYRPESRHGTPETIILTSPDGIQWTSRTSGLNFILNGVTYGNSTFLAVGPNGAIITSPDGVTWTSRNSGITNDLFAVTYGNGTFIAVGNAGTIITSTDGTSWTSRESGIARASLNGVSCNKDTFVIVGYSVNIYSIFSAILTSHDGTTWEAGNSEITNDYLNGVAYGNGFFVAVGYDHTLLATILTSPDGLEWTTSLSGPINGLHGVTYGNSSFVAVGDDGNILQSDPVKY